ncbi:MAG: triple tyrosine motif-containing protein [Ferruginibacter sp.]
MPDGSIAQKINRYNTFSYNVNEGLLQSHVMDMAFDNNNFGWLSFDNGLQKFDGEHFVKINIQPGLPDDKNVTFFKSSKGTLYLSHVNGISNYNNNSNTFTQVYFYPAHLLTPPIFLGEDEGIIYFFNGSGNILGLSEESGHIIKNINPAFNQTKSDIFSIIPSDNIINHTIAIWTDSILVFWDLQKEKALHNSRKIDNIHLLSSPHLRNDHEVLFLNTDILPDKNNLISYDYLANKMNVISTKQKEEKPLRCDFFTWQNNDLFSYYNHIYEVDAKNFSDLNEIVSLQNKPVAGNAIVNKMLEDNFGNLYVLTINNGFRKVIRRNYPLRYFGTDVKEDNFIISICADKKANRILAGTFGNGLLVFDTMQQLVKHIESFPGQPKNFSPSGIIKTGNDEYLLFCWGQQKTWLVSKEFTSFTSLPFARSAPNVDYYGNVIAQDNHTTFFQSANVFYKINNDHLSSISQYGLENNLGFGSTISNGLLVVFSNDKVSFIDTSTFTLQKQTDLKNTGGVRCMATDRDGNILIGGNKGLFKITASGKLLFHLNKDHGLPDECIYAIMLDAEGHIWCSCNKGIFKISDDGAVFHLKKEDGLQENEFNTNVVTSSPDGELFFGGVNGITSFFPAAIKDFEEKINVFITGIKVNNEPLNIDTAVWEIKNIKLPYYKSSLSFDFIAMGNNNPGQYVYQYKMEGIDDQWIQNNSFQTVRYYLQPGKYTFKIYASRFFNKDAVPIKEIFITIMPPFWKTWWFIALLISVGTGLMAYIISRYNRYKFRKHLRIIEDEKQMQKERERISRDLHDNIGAYANAILYNTELLENEENSSMKSKLMGDLKFASKDIISSLRETIWAFKKDHYSAEECLIRIKNFTQALSRYYPKINFKISGDAPLNVILSSTTALNLVRIVQEAVTNAIKHSGASVINIINEVKQDEWKLGITDTGKGFDAERSATSGNGLQNMQQRAKDAGFGITITSGDLGTGIEINIKI